MLHRESPLGCGGAPSHPRPTISPCDSTNGRSGAADRSRARNPTADALPRGPSALRLRADPALAMTPEVDTTPPATARRPGTPVALRARALPPGPRLPGASRPASQLSLEHVLDGRILQRELGVHPLQLRV